MTIHCGVTMDVINRMKAEGRYMDVVSRGGSFITGWMLYNEKIIHFMNAMMIS